MHEPACIWVVDDDRSVRFVLATALREAGFDVVGFDSAGAVLDALDVRPPPRLLFTDVRMPNTLPANTPATRPNRSRPGKPY
jgi:two-component system nitrogen regulation response regulator GlnG